MHEVQPATSPAMLCSLCVLFGAVHVADALAPFTFGSTRPAAIQRLPDWFRQHGGDDDAVAIEDSPIGWALVARRAIAPGEHVVTTPRALCLAATDGPGWLRATAARPDAPPVEASTVIAARLLDEVPLSDDVSHQGVCRSEPQRVTIVHVPLD